MPDLIDVELFPSMRRAALTITANLKTEEALDLTSNPVIVRLDDSGASGFVNELDEILAADCVHELVIHGFFRNDFAILSVPQGSGFQTAITDHRRLGSDQLCDGAHRG